MWDLKQWRRAFWLGLCHSTTSAARRARSLEASQTLCLWGEPCIPKWSSGICQELLSLLTSDPLLKSLPTHCSGCSTGTAHSERDFRMTHWIIKMSLWSIPFTKGHGWSPFRAERHCKSLKKKTQTTGCVLPPQNYLQLYLNPAFAMLFFPVKAVYKVSSLPSLLQEGFWS